MTEYPIDLRDDFAAAVRDGTKRATRERPIIMSGESVRAILAGIKTETRRALAVQPEPGMEFVGPWEIDGERQYTAAGLPFYLFRDQTGQHYRWRGIYGEPGDRLWVREGYAIVPRTAYARSTGVVQTLRPDDPYEHDAAIYRAEWDRGGSLPWRSPLHMPRWASRLTLEDVAVRAERLQAISAAGTVAEGFGEGAASLRHSYYWSRRQCFAQTWDRLNARRGFGWAGDPWVWVVTFKAIAP